MIDKAQINCPHCGYVMDDDDMLKSDHDLFAIAPNEEEVEAQCPKCDTGFWVKGTYLPQYETFKTEDEL